MSHKWNVLLVHHPLGLLWPFLLLAAVTTLVIGVLRRRGTVSRLLLRLDTLFWVLGIVGAVMAIVGEIACAGLVAEEFQCGSAMKELATGLFLYTEDWDRGLPPGDRWFDVVRSRAGEGTLPHPCPAYRGTYAYAMNAFAAGISLETVEAPADTVLLAEYPCRTANETTTSLHPQAYRHHDAANIAYLDGHVIAWGRWRTEPLRWQP